MRYEKQALCYQKLFRPFTIWINCSSDPKNFATSRPSALNFKSFSRTLEQFFLTIGHNIFGNKISYFFFIISFMASLCSTKVHIAWCISILPSKLQSKSKLQEWRGKEEWWCNGAWEWFVRISVLFAIVIRRKKNCTREELTTRTNWAWISPFFSSHLVASYQSSAAELCLTTISAHSELKILILFMWAFGVCKKIDFISLVFWQQNFYW